MKKASVETKQRRRKNGQIREAWRRMVHNKKAVGAMIVLAILLFIVIFPIIPSFFYIHIIYILMLYLLQFIAFLLSFMPSSTH